jgi:hypothetical protein
MSKMNRAERRAEKPINLDALFRSHLDDLAAAWVPEVDSVGYVYLHERGGEASFGWLDRSGSVDRLLELADRMRADVDAKRRVQTMATEILSSPRDGQKQVVVVAPSGAALVTVEPAAFIEANATGQTEAARAGRAAIIRSVAQLALAGVQQRLDAGRRLEDSVVLVVDPADRRASRFADVLRAATKFDFSRQHVGGQGPMVVVFEREVLRRGLADLRPKVASSLDQPAPDGHARAVCMAHGGDSTGVIRFHGSGGESLFIGAN